MTGAEVERRRAQVGRFAVQGMTAAEITQALEKMCTALKGEGAPIREWHYLDVRQRTVERDISIIRDGNRRRVQTMTPDEMAVTVLGDYTAEHRELWATVRSCGTNPKYAHIKIGALNGIARLRDATLKNLSRLGVLPEDAVKDPTFRWLMSLSEEEIQRIVNMTPTEAEAYLERQSEAGALRLIS